MKKENKEIAIVFGLFETGLGVIRSLGRSGVKVYGVDYKKDIAFYSRYCTALLCPNPATNESEFIEWILNRFPENSEKIPVFITGDNYLLVFSSNREILSEKFTFNLIPVDLLNSLSDKFSQYLLAKSANVNVPETWLVDNYEDIEQFKKCNTWPLFIKGREVNSWRKAFGGSTKGFKVNNFEELSNIISEPLRKKVSIIIQEVIQGPDSNHYKYCAYISQEGKTLAEISLQKIRQYPIRYGVGSSVKTVDNNHLTEQGRLLFSNIKFKGVGSAEFKIDQKDGKLKLIELNPRYWQQNAIGEFAGVNFPLINYSDLKNQEQNPTIHFKAGYIWINRYMDFSAYLKYSKLGELTFLNWRKSLRGKKTYADFSWDDPIPFFYEFGFGMKLFKLPVFIYKKLFSVEK